MVMKMSMGVISFYTIYAVGYIATQILTPLLTAKFYLKDLIAVMPKILAGSTIAGIIGIFALPFAYLPLKIEMEEKKWKYLSIILFIASIMIIICVLVRGILVCAGFLLRLGRSLTLVMRRRLFRK